MATPIFCCGFGCGVDGAHWNRQSGAATYTTSAPLSGSRSLRCAPTASADGLAGTATTYGAAGSLVFRFRVNFTTLPNNTTCIASGAASSIAGAYFNPADSKIYAGTGTAALGATGVSVTTGVTYYIDVRVNVSASPWLVDVSVNGSACGQRSSALSAEGNAHGINLGFLHSCTADALFDDVVVSATSADFPIGDGYVNEFIPTADGTHNVAGGNDFERSATGTDIAVGTTTAFQLIDDVPLKSGVVSEYINLIAPPNATDYVEVVIGPAAGVSTPTVAPRAVEVILAYASATSGTFNLRIALNDNGTLNDVLNTNTAPGTTAVYGRKHYAAGPAGAWVIGGGGNGDFTDLRMRCFTSDPAPDPWWASAMVEAEFAVDATNLVIQNASHDQSAANLALTQVHALAVQNAAHAHSAGSLALTQVHSLVVQSAAHSQTAENLAVVETHNLTIQNGSHAHTADSLALTQAHALTVQDASHSHTAEALTLTQVHTLVIENSSHDHTADNLVVNEDSQAGVSSPFPFFFGRVGAVATATDLVIQDASHAHSAENLPLAQVHSLAVQNASHGHTAESLTLTQAHALVVNSADHAHTSENPALTQVHALLIANADHAHAADNVPITASSNLVVQSAVHAHSADNLNVTQTHALTVQDASHNHAAESLTLTQVHVLTVQNADHSHTAENLTLAGAGDLVVQNAAHGHSAENLVLAQVHNLTIESGTHGHAVQNVSLTQAHSIAVADSAHDHTADNLALQIIHVLAIQSANHTQTAESLTLTQVHSLSVSGSIHALTSENLILTQAHSLITASATHGHTAANLTLIEAANLSIDSALHLHSADALILTQAHSLTVNSSAHSHTATSLTLTQVHFLVVQNAFHALASRNIRFGPPRDVYNVASENRGVQISHEGHLMTVPAEGNEAFKVSAESHVLLVSSEGRTKEI